MLLECSELVVEVNEARPRVVVALYGLAHGIGGLELMGKAEHVQPPLKRRGQAVR